MLTGSGRAFCVGQDLKEHLAGLTGEADVPLSDTVEKHYNPIVLALATMPKPVVAAVNGVAAGAGASLAFAADFRILVDSAGYNTSFAGRRAVVRHRLELDAAAPGRARQGDGAALLPAHRRRPQEALELGLATQVVPQDELRRRRRRAGGAGWRPVRRSSFGSIRQAVAYSAAHPLEESLAFEAEKMALTGGTEDHLAAVNAFVAKEKPVYRGR